MKTVFDKDGKSVTVEAVDAREYVATGNWSYTDPTQPADAPVNETPEQKATREQQKERDLLADEAGTPEARARAAEARQLAQQQQGTAQAQNDPSGAANGATSSTPASDSSTLRQDGPTLEEFVAAGYKAENYPPEGYAAKPSVPTKDGLAAPESMTKEQLKAELDSYSIGYANGANKDALVELVVAARTTRQ